MATTTAVGGSQIDVQGLVSQLVAAERATPDAQIARQTTQVTTQISALGALMGSLSTFRSALTSLKSVDVFSTRSVSTTDDAVLGATATSKAVPGSFDIDVVQLAKAQQISSGAFSGGSSSVVGTGTLTLSLGDKNFSVAITDANSTLAGIRDAINSASDNPGVRATLVQGTTGSRLVLSSSQTGAANKITVAQSGGDGGLAQIAYSAATPGSYTVIKPAQDAIIEIAGAQTTSASNSIDNAIDGVSLTVKQETTEESGPVTVTVAYDNAGVTARIRNFVSAYNALAGQIGRLRSYDATSKTAGPMLGDSLLTSIESELRSALGAPVSGQAEGFKNLASIGITTQLDGTLGVDDTKLNKALSTNFEAVGKLFGSDNGIAARLYKQVDDRLKTGGAIDTRSKNLT
ncbi:MAG TPA: flagellar filament capping protein FliD, partial [Povalibacter sp.]|nr:flagellar filament capping protein FliD [Povalibacter sp.]